MGKSKRYRMVLDCSIPEEYKEAFNEEIENEVLERGKSLAIMIILLEIAMILTYAAGIMNSGKMNICYLSMYLIMIAAMFIYLEVYRKIKHAGSNKARLRKFVIFFFTAFLLFWSALISILDQINYGQIVVYLTAIIAIAVVGYIKPPVLLVMYLGCHLFFIIALPYFQKSATVAYGNMINSTIMLCLSIVISVKLYHNRMDDFSNKRIIVEKNEELYEINQRLTETNERLNGTNDKLSEANSQLKEANDKLELLSITDPGTGLFNRRKFDDALAQEWDRCRRYNEKISMLFIDIDYFKKYNDNYGHLSGDLCIRKIAEIIMNMARRAGDITARYGGEEFVVVIPRIDETTAYEMADNIRKNVGNLKIQHEYSKVAAYVTVSIGLYTVVPTNNISITEFIEKADKALYMAKQNNRNQVFIYKDQA